MDNATDGAALQDAIRRLSECGYAVLPAGQGYTVEHLTDGDDVSRARDLGDLVELADLFEWREQYQASRGAMR